mgnify:CR=1 FL=1
MINLILSHIARLLLNILHTLFWRVCYETYFYGYRLVIPRGVFHPKYTFSTGILLKCLNLGISRLLKKCNFCVDVGSGSGIVSIYLASKNYYVISTDISYDAVLTTKVNAKLNGAFNNIDVLLCNHVSSLRKSSLIICNPPYLPLYPKNKIDYLWCIYSPRYLSLLLRYMLNQCKVMIFTLSSLSGVDAFSCCKLISQIQTFLDRVYVLLCVRK